MGPADVYHNTKENLSYASVVRGHQEATTNGTIPKAGVKEDSPEAIQNYAWDFLSPKSEESLTMPVDFAKHVPGEPITYAKALLEAHKRNDGKSIVSSTSLAVPYKDPTARTMIADTSVLVPSETASRGPWNKSWKEKAVNDNGDHLEAAVGLEPGPASASGNEFPKRDLDKSSVLSANISKHKAVLTCRTENKALGHDVFDFGAVPETSAKGGAVIFTRQAFRRLTVSDGTYQLHKDILLPWYEHVGVEEIKQETKAEGKKEGTEIATNSTMMRERQKAIEELEECRAAIVASMYDQEIPFNLWDNPLYHDVEIRCQGQQWEVHREILEGESHWFAEHMPPKNPDGSPVVWALDNHEPAQLNTVLEWMYCIDHQGEFLNADGPLRGDAIVNGAMQYICGMSVDCTGLMEKALSNLHTGINALINIMPVDYLSLTPAFWDPLYLALAITFNQGERPAMAPLRHRMAQIVDASLMYLILNPTFRSEFCPKWSLLLPQLVIDNNHFRECRMLGPASQPEKYQDLRAQESAQRAEVAPRADGEQIEKEYTEKRAAVTAAVHRAVVERKVEEKQNIAAQNPHADKKQEHAKSFKNAEKQRNVAEREWCTVQQTHKTNAAAKRATSKREKSLEKELSATKERKAEASKGKKTGNARAKVGDC